MEIYNLSRSSLFLIVIFVSQTDPRAERSNIAAAEEQKLIYYSPTALPPI